MGTWRIAVSHLSWGLLAAISCTVLLLEGSASAQFAPSGGALLHSEEATKPPPPVTTEPPEEEAVKYDIAGYDKGNFNGFFVQSRDGQFRLNIGGYSQLRYDLVWRETPPAGERKFESGFVVPRTRFFFEGKMTDRIEYQLRLQIDDAGDFALLVAYAGYNFKDYHHRSARNNGAWNLRVGRQFIAIAREDWAYVSDMLTTENSAVDSVWHRHLGRPAGVLRKGPRSRLVCPEQRVGRGQGRLSRQHHVSSTLVGTRRGPTARG